MTEAEMRRRSLSKMTFVLALLSISSIYCCNAQMPLLMWTSEGFNIPRLDQPPAGQVVFSGQLVSYLKSALTTAPHNVLLFLQDKLSMEDFTKYGGVYGNKQDSVFLNVESALQASTNPLVLPSLDWSASDSILDLLQRELGVPAIHIDPDTLKEFQLNASQPSLLAIQLPYSAGESKEMLQKNDEVIGEVLGMYKSYGVPYTAVYTGLKPSRAIQDNSILGEGSIGRSLLQTQTPTPKPVVYSSGGRPCILLWAERLRVRYSQGNWADLDLGTSVDLNGSSCNDTAARLVLNNLNVSNFQNFRLIFSLRKSFFPVSARNWAVLEQVILEYNGDQIATFNGSRGVYSPAEYSFRCESVSSLQSPLLVPRSTADIANQWQLSFLDFQIQGFNVTGEAFSYASDCASFFTPGIWMGLLISLLLMLVLTYGLHMIMQLRTMDRFDDPKGPAISVPQSE